MRCVFKKFLLVSGDLDIKSKSSGDWIIEGIIPKRFEKEFPTNVFLLKKDSGLRVDSTILLNQIRTIDKTRLIKRIGSLDFYLMNKVEIALKISLGL